MMLDQITPVLLTYNEAPNIARTLSHLHWARDVVVLDSGSTDETLAILAKWSNVRVFSRPFDSHADKWRYALTETEITTPWVLRLDADYQLTEKFVYELSQLDPPAEVSAYAVSFDYAIFSHKLRSSLYPPNTILLRRGRFKIRDNGHTESWDVDGPIGSLQAHVTHDDWKSVQSWINSQGVYMSRELTHISAIKCDMRDRLRLIPPLMPIAAFLYCLFGKGLILDGRSGLFYALQRLVAEAILSLMVLEKALRAKSEPPAEIK
jgi:glycosyltransferase involved in cell wall biosynthesis